MAETQKRTLTISVETEERAEARALEALRRIDAGEGYQGEYYSFRTLPLLFKIFSIKRWEVVSELQSHGPSSLRGLARALGRDVKRVHEDVDLLLGEGIVERNADGKLTVPFAGIHIEADLLPAEMRDAAA